MSVNNEMQQFAVYILYFTADLLYMFRVPFTPIIRSAGNCSRRPLVRVICHDRLDGVASNPIESIYSQVTNTLHHGQIKTPNLTMVKRVSDLTTNRMKNIRRTQQY
jgi:hypothetical protein